MTTAAVRRHLDALTAEDYLAIHEATSAPLRAVWQLTQRWLKDGESQYSGLLDAEGKILEYWYLPPRARIEVEEGDKIIVEGPFFLDLVARTSEPSLGDVELPAGVYRRVDLRFDPNEASDDASLRIGGTLELADGVRAVELGLPINEDARFEHLRVQDESANAQHLTDLHVKLGVRSGDNFTVIGCRTGDFGSPTPTFGVVNTQQTHRPPHLQGPHLQGPHLPSPPARLRASGPNVCSPSSRRTPSRAPPRSRWTRSTCGRTCSPSSA